MADSQIAGLDPGAIVATNRVPHQDAGALLDAVYNTWDDVREFITGKKIYAFAMTQSGTSDPTVTEHINQLGVTITWARTAQGTYRATASAAIFLVGKVPAKHRTTFINGSTVFNCTITRINDTIIEMINFSSASATDGLMQNDYYVEYPIFY